VLLALVVGAALMLAGVDISGIALLSQSNTTHVAVVGGTGVYEGVTGTVTSVSRGENTPYTDDTVHLIWP
jgi:purine nucleoside phosphorylase